MKELFCPFIWAEYKVLIISTILSHSNPIICQSSWYSVYILSSQRLDWFLIFFLHSNHLCYFPAKQSNVVKSQCFALPNATRDTDCCAFDRGRTSPKATPSPSTAEVLLAFWVQSGDGGRCKIWLHLHMRWSHPCSVLLSYLTFFPVTCLLDKLKQKE